MQQAIDDRRERRLLAAGERICARQVRGDARVGEARGRAHHGREETALRHDARAGHLHLADHAEAIDLGHQRAQVVREFLGQHRQHAAREVDRGRALARLGIEGRARPHVVADVRDGDEEPEARAARLGKDRIVEVARVLAVDRDERRRAQVFASLERCRRDFAPVAARHGERFGRKLVATGRARRSRVRSPNSRRRCPAARAARARRDRGSGPAAR